MTEDAPIQPQDGATPDDPDATSATPPDTSAGGAALGVPHVPTRLVGREDDLAALLTLLDVGAARLITLVVPPGVGKTRLGLALAEHAAGRFADGVTVVPLAPLAAAAQVGPALAQALGVIEVVHQPLAESLKDRLRPQHRFLVLDNFEHVHAAGALVAELLGASPRLTVLATSRTPLGVPGEREVLVAPLVVPDPAGLPPLPVLAGVPSVALFMERAQAARPGFALSADNAAGVAAICARLDGLPLAIELAAARIRLLTVSELHNRLGQGLGLLARGPSHLSPRHRTLRDAIAWSHSLLGPAERALFRRLGVFSGGWTLEAAEAVCGPTLPGDAEPRGGPLDVPTVLTNLLDQSLVESDPAAAAGLSRFRMLETIREYALEELRASGEEDAIRRRHAEYIWHVALPAARTYMRPDSAITLLKLGLDHGNVGAALHWSLHEPSAGLLHVRLPASLWWFWYMRALFSEGRRVLEPVLEQGRFSEESPRDYLWAAAGASLLALRQGDYAASSAWGQQGLVLSRQLGDDDAIATVLTALGLTAVFRGEYQTADQLLTECLERVQAKGDPFFLAAALHNLGRVRWFQGRLSAAQALAHEGLTITRATGNHWGSAYFLNMQATIAFAQHEQQRADALLTESLTLFTSSGDAWGICYVQFDRAYMALAQRDLNLSLERFSISLRQARELGDRWLMPQCLRGIGQVAMQLGRPADAARLFGAAEAHRAAIGAAFPVLDVADYARDEARTRRILGVRPFAEVWAAGERLSVARAADEALALAAELTTAPTVAALHHSEGAARRNGTVERVDRRGPPPFVLTEREREIAALIGEGLTSRAIARRLVIAVRTVDSHAEHIREKLGVRSRAQIAAWAVDQGLVSDPPG